MKAMKPAAILFLLLFLTLFGCGGDDDDDDSGSAAGDDDDAVDDDDSVADDDATDDDDQIDDDDIADDDEIADDDDVVDDDDAIDDDDVVDDDDIVTDPYQGMSPSGNTLGDMIGISSHMSKSTSYVWKREFEIAKQVEAGVRLSRTDFHWHVIEPSDDAWDFAGYDTMVDLLLDDGIESEAMMAYSVDWAAPGGVDDLIDPAVYADFCGHVADHFSDRIRYYEVWNEPNTERFWQPQPNPDTYGALLKACYQAVHAADPTAEVLFGGLSPFDMYIFGPDGVWNFIARVAEAHPDICDYFDVMAIHPYAFIQTSSPEYVFDVGFFAYPNLVQSIDHARELLTAAGCGDKPIQFTEMGWTSLTTGDDKQAAFLARGFLLSAMKGIDRYYWYTFWDGSGAASLPTEDYFGLYEYPTDQNPAPKPSFAALVGIHLLLDDYQYAGDLGTALNWPENQTALVFENGDGDRFVGAWHSDGNIDKTYDVEIPLPDGFSGDWTLYDQDGAEVDSGTGATSVSVELTGRVLYLLMEK